MPLRVQNRIQVQMYPWMLVETTRVTEFEYYFTCTRNSVHLYSVNKSWQNDICSFRAMNVTVTLSLELISF